MVTLYPIPLKKLCGSRRIGKLTKITLKWRFAPFAPPPPPPPPVAAPLTTIGTVPYKCVNKRCTFPELSNGDAIYDAAVLSNVVPMYPAAQRGKPSLQVNIGEDTLL